MSHVECPHCKMRHHTTTFGCGGPFGGHSLYTICDDCGRTLECRMDNDDVDSDEAEAAAIAFQKQVDATIAAQFVPGGQPIKADPVRLGPLYVSWTPHIPAQEDTSHV